MVSTSNITEFSKRKPPKKSKKLSAANIQKIRKNAAAAKRERNAKDEAKRKRGRSIARRMKNTAVSTAKYVKRKITGKSKYKNLTKYEENRAASKIQAAARGYMARKDVIGLTAAQKRALDPVVSNNIFYNAPEPPSRLSVAVGKLFNGTRSAAGAVKKRYPKIEEAVRDKADTFAKYLATQQGAEFQKSAIQFVLSAAVLHLASTTPGLKPILDMPNGITVSSIRNSALAGWLQYWSPKSVESKLMYEIVMTKSSSGYSSAGLVVRAVGAVVVALSYYLRNKPTDQSRLKMSYLLRLLRAFMKEVLENVFGKVVALFSTPIIAASLIPTSTPRPTYNMPDIRPGSTIPMHANGEVNEKALWGLYISGKITLDEYIKRRRPAASPRRSAASPRRPAASRSPRPRPRPAASPRMVRVGNKSLRYR